MTRVLVDTNLIVRLLTGSATAPAEAAAEFFGACDRGETLAIVLPVVLAECVFVLESFYKLPRRRIADALAALLASPGVTIEPGPICRDALQRYAESKVHFVDCLLAAHGVARGMPVATLDSDFRRFPDVEIHRPKGRAGS